MKCASEGLGKQRIHFQADSVLGKYVRLIAYFHDSSVNNKKGSHYNCPLLTYGYIPGGKRVAPSPYRMIGASLGLPWRTNLFKCASPSGTVSLT